MRLELKLPIIALLWWKCDDNGGGGDPDLGDGDSGACNNDGGGDPFAVVLVVWQPFRTVHSYYVGRISQV